MNHEHRLGDPLFVKPSAFDIWMDQEGYKIILDIINSPKNKCYICGSNKKITEHHIIPTHLGGTDLYYNLSALCESCHRELHYHNRDQKTDKAWILIIKNMKENFERKVYKAY